MSGGSARDGVLPAAPVVAVDANGADLGPAEVAAGARMAVAEDALRAEGGLRVILFGPAAELGDPGPGIEIVDAPVSIAKSPDPARSVRSTPEASIVQAARAIAAGRAQALVCAGGTGAALAAGYFHIRRARGIYRPALALPLPAPGRLVTLLDVGANAEARREHLVQFAFMGAALARLLGAERPRVGLLSNGSEADRGTEAVIEAGAELRERLAAGGDEARRAAEGWARGAGAFELVGNIEGGDLVGGVADVAVCDGFTGNISLKLMEGVSQALLHSVREAAMSSSRAKLGGALLRPALGSLREQIDPERQGGAYLLGLRALGVIPHGRFTQRGFQRAIARAAAGAREDIVGSIQRSLEQAGALREGPVSANGASLTDTK